MEPDIRLYPTFIVKDSIISSLPKRDSASCEGNIPFVLEGELISRMAKKKLDIRGVKGQRSQQQPVLEGVYQAAAENQVISRF